MGWPRRLERASSTYRRRLRFEALEERRLLTIFADTFVQVSRIESQEATVLTLDENGQFQVYYHPNDELGYVDPATGDLIFVDYYPGTSIVLVLNGVVSGNLSDLTGVNYSNG